MSAHDPFIGKLFKNKTRHGKYLKILGLGILLNFKISKTIIFQLRLIYQLNINYILRSIGLYRRTNYLFLYSFITK